MAPDWEKGNGTGALKTQETDMRGSGGGNEREGEGRKSGERKRKATLVFIQQMQSTYPKPGTVWTKQNYKGGQYGLLLEFAF